MLQALVSHNQESNEQMELGNLLGAVPKNGFERDLMINLLRILNYKRLINGRFEREELVTLSITPFGEMYLKQLINKESQNLEN
jgi:hypothetical protein